MNLATLSFRNKSPQRVEPFRVELNFPSFPPTIAWVDAELSQALGAGCRVLQWAIVSADPVKGQLCVEGSMTVDSTDPLKEALN